MIDMSLRCDCGSKIFTSGDIGRDQDSRRHRAVNEITNAEDAPWFGCQVLGNANVRGRIICPPVEPCNALAGAILKSRGLELRRLLVPMSAKSFGLELIVVMATAVRRI
jgi:hypothetical protein